MDIFGDLRYFQKKIENLKNSFSRTSLTWNGTKSCGFDVEDASRYLFFNVVNHCQSNDTSLRERSTKTSIFLESTLDCPLMVF